MRRAELVAAAGTEEDAVVAAAMAGTEEKAETEEKKVVPAAMAGMEEERAVPAVKAATRVARDATSKRIRADPRRR